MKKIFQLVNKNISSLKSSLIKEKDLCHLPIITISREMGSGGRLIAYLVAKKLGNKWQIYHKDLIDKIAHQSHLERELIKDIDERRIGLVDEIISNIFGKRYPSLTTYYKHLVKILFQISQRGYAVIVGRGAEYVIPQALKIRIICEMEQRIKWEMEFEKLTRSQAAARIDRSDESRKDFIEALYKHDPKKAHHYDLVIRTGPDLSLEDAAELIVKAARIRFKM